MLTDGERLAALEATVAGVASDLGEMKSEEIRTRTRLHNLEGLAGTLVEQEKVRRREARARDERFNRNLRLLTFVVAVATLVTPFLYHSLIGG